ncbi:MAG: hypothetical protein GWN64_07730 [Candidatus Thorarchaeota archaeon]|nr:hypothetical protein [Candidatus Thorarchaeota archaeon]
MDRYPPIEKITAFPLLAVDIETYDPELRELGPGMYRRDGNILGVSISNGEFSEYYNIGHRGIKQEEKENNIKYLRELLNTDVPKIGANLLYDADWLSNHLGINLKGQLNDVQIAEPLIDEYRDTYSLNSLAQKYLGEEKVKSDLELKCTSQGLKGDFRQYMYTFTHKETRNYAIADAELPIRIFKKQESILLDEGLDQLYRMEMDLYPLLLQMRQAGVRVDKQKIANGIKFLLGEIKSMESAMYSQYGKFNVKSSKEIEKVFNEIGLAFERRPPTEKMKEKGITQGNPNFDKNALSKIDHPICKSILGVRECRTLLNTFFVNSFSQCNVNGRIHSSFNPLRSDQYGTVSGRFSSSKPNLQQIPSKDDHIIGDTNSMELCRSVFIPEEGCDWAKLDWSQIEYRLIAHYAEGAKSDDIRKRYNEDPSTDYHAWVMEMTGLNRKEAKMLNFGMAYYMGVASCSSQFGWSLAEAEDFINHYHKNVPFVKTTRANVVRTAKRRGFIRTILGRRARVSNKMRMEQKEHSIFNRLIQGSAADLMKKAMVEAHKAGVFDVLTPHLTVHDELDVSVPKTDEGQEALMELKNIMETCIQLRVPIVADLEVGPNWAHVK